MALKKHFGNCHCQSIKYEVSADLQKGTYKCNCKYCAKVRNWGCMVKPADFNWIQGQEFVSTYKTSPNGGEFYFCKKCGVRIGTKGYIEEIGGDFMSFTISTLESITPEELNQLPVQHMDGLKDDWFHIPQYKDYL